MAQPELASSSSTQITISTGALRGSDGAPTAIRVCRPAGPKHCSRLLLAATPLCFDALITGGPAIDALPESVEVATARLQFRFDLHRFLLVVVIDRDSSVAPGSLATAGRPRSISDAPSGRQD